MIWGRQDRHIPREGRERIHAALEDAGTRFSWLEVNGQHAFGRHQSAGRDPSLSGRQQTQFALGEWFAHRSWPPQTDLVHRSRLADGPAGAGNG